MTTRTAPHLHHCASDVSASIDRLLDACVTAVLPEALVAHGIGLLAADRLRATGQGIPPLLHEERELAALVHLAGHSLLRRIRDLLDGPMILIKGPEVAAHYPTPTARGFGDLDILVPDSAAAKATLLAAGFVEVDDYEFPHSQRPLRWPHFPLLIELHHHLPWLRWTPAPSVDEYFALACPSRTGIQGLSTLPPVDHALLVASHAWRHAPLRRLGDLIDVAVLIDGQDLVALRQRARELRIEQVWQTTLAAMRALIRHDCAQHAALPRWARHLYPPRERTVAEHHIARWIGGFSVPTMRGKARNLVETLRDDFGPLPQEPWTDKVARTGRAIREARAPALLRQRYAKQARPGDSSESPR